MRANSTQINKKTFSKVCIGCFLDKYCYQRRNFMRKTSNKLNVEFKNTCKVNNQIICEPPCLSSNHYVNIPEIIMRLITRNFPRSKLWLGIHTFILFHLVIFVMSLARLHITISSRHVNVLNYLFQCAIF